MNAPVSRTLPVPGASLYYEVRGSGPALLLIPGGNGDAGPFARLANELASSYTVISYDRRGYTRSPLDHPPVDRHRLRADVDDAHRLLDAVTEAPAHVFGSSSGAIVALDLLTRHPDQIQTLVAHEPPLAALVPDTAVQLRLAQQVYDTYHGSGVDSAMRVFNAEMGMGPLLAPPAGAKLPPEVAEMLSRIHRNQEFWLEHELRHYIRVVPDLKALQAVSGKLVLAGGADSRQYFPYRPNLTLADRLGRTVTDFPGGHIGYVTHPAPFAALLTQLLAPVATNPGAS